MWARPSLLRGRSRDSDRMPSSRQLHEGGAVIETVTLQNAAPGGTLTPSHTQQRLKERRFGDAIREIFRIDVDALTGPEAGYLVNFRDADALRARRATATRQRESRLPAKGLSEREDPSVDHLSFPVANPLAAPPIAPLPPRKLLPTRSPHSMRLWANRKA